MANFYGTDIDDISGADANQYGGDGNDILKGAGAANALYGGEGNDVLAGGSAFTTPTNYTGTGTAADPFVLTETQAPSGDDLLEGGSGSDAVYGFDGDDIIYGGEGDDQGIGPIVGIYHYKVAGLFGGEGDDRIYGGGGDDLIDGGVGRDVVSGGDGADTYVFGSLDDMSPKGGSADWIYGFSHSQGDIIDLSAIDAKEGGADDKFKYIGDNDFGGNKGELRYERGKLTGDTDGDGKKDFMIKILGAEHLTKGDFEL